MGTVTRHTLTPLPNHQPLPALLDENGAMWVRPAPGSAIATTPPEPYGLASSGYVTSAAVAVGETVIGHCSGQVSASAPTATYYVQIFDLAAVPADGATPTLVGEVTHATGTPTAWEEPVLSAGVLFESGLVVVLSSTASTKTEVASPWLLANAAVRPVAP